MTFTFSSAPSLATELQPSSASSIAHVGWSAAASGTIGLLGAPGFGPSQGLVFLYANLHQANGTVTETATLSSSDAAPNRLFGFSTAMSGDRAVVGAIGHSAYLYRNLAGASGQVLEQAILNPSVVDAGQFQYAQAVALAGDIAVIGSGRAGAGDTGQAYLFRDLGTVTGTITENAILVASDPGPSGANDGPDNFGASVAVSGTTALIGARGANVGGNRDQGAAYVFRDLGSAAGTVTQNAKLVASDGAQDEFFGENVALDGSIGLVSANDQYFTPQSTVYVFRGLDVATGVINEAARLSRSDEAPNDGFGSSVAVAGATGLVGARTSQVGANAEQGSAYLFLNLDSASGDVTESVKLYASNGAPNDNFGSSVSLSGDRFVIGAEQYLADGPGKGYAGQVSTFTTANAGTYQRQATDGISFESRQNWVIGETSSGNFVVLSAGDRALIAAGNEVRVGSTATAGNNWLVVDGTLQTDRVVVGTTGGATPNRLAGHGIINGSVEILGNSGIMPGDQGNDPGLLTINGNLSLSNASTNYFQFGNRGVVGGLGNSLLEVGGDLVLGGEFEIYASGSGFGVGAYRMINYTGTLTDHGAFATNGGVPAQFSDHLVVSTAVDGQVNLIVAGPDNVVQFWDGAAGPSGDGTVQGGDGSWTNFNPYFTDPTGTESQTWQNGTALFAGSAGTVSVDDEIHFQRIQFMQDGYVLAQGADPDTGLVLDTPDGSRAMITTGNEVTATINANLSGAGGLQSNGGFESLLILGGNNTYTGGTTLNGGTLRASADENLGDVSGDLDIGVDSIFQFGAGFDLARHVSVAAGAIDTNGFDGSISGVLTEVPTEIAGSSITKTGEGTLTLLNPDNSFQNFYIRGGVLQQGAAGAFTEGAFYSTFDQSADNAAVVLDLNDFNATARGLYLAADDGVDLGEGTLTLDVQENLNLPATDYNTFVEGEITGNGDVVKDGLGSAYFAGANSYSGGTDINDGTLFTDNLSALGTGRVDLNGGILNVLSELEISLLDWAPGKLEVVLGPTLVNVTGDLTNDGDGGSFIVAHDGINPLLQRYTVLTYGGVTDFTAADFSAEFNHNIQNVSFEYGFELTPSEVIFEFTRATAWGPILQNSAPVFTPTFADFIVQGPVRTGELDENNIIKSLTFDPGSSLRVYNNLEVSSGEFRVNSGRAAIKGGSLSIPGQFHKRGGGLLDIRSRVAVQGNGTIHAGALAVNGVFQTPLLIVTPGATLMGEGLVDGSVLNSGTIAPGNSIGTLAISHNYTQARSGTYAFEVANPGHHDFLIIGGTARLDGTLEVIPVSGYDPAYGDVMPILRAGTIEGRFATIEVPGPDRNRGRFFTLDRLTERRADAGTGMLVIAPASYTLVAEGGNQHELAEALDEWIGIEGGDIGRVTLALDLLPEEAYSAAFDALLPHQHGAALALGNSVLQQQNQTLISHLDSRRLGRRAVRQASQGTVIAGVVEVPAGAAKSAKTPVSAAPPAPEFPWNAWATGTGAFSGDVLNSDIDGDYHSGGVLVGVDRAIGDEFALGFLLGYNNTEADFSRGSDLELEQLQAGLYATWDRGGWYANAAAGGGSADYDASRRITLPGLGARDIDAEGDGYSLFALLSGGYDFTPGQWTHGPRASLAWARTDLGDIKESGGESLDLLLRDASSDSLRSRLGYRLAYNARVSDRVTLIPELRADWEHEYLDADGIHTSLDGGNGPSFRYTPDDGDKDRLILGAGLGTQWGERIFTHIGYQAQMGSETIHSATVGVNFSF